MQTTLPLHDFDVLCVDGPLRGRLYPNPQAAPGAVQYLDVAHIPYRVEPSETGEWFFLHAKDLDLDDDF